jgi:hypothetical protein
MSRRNIKRQAMNSFVGYLARKVWCENARKVRWRGGQNHSFMVYHRHHRGGVLPMVAGAIRVGEGLLVGLGVDPPLLGARRRVFAYWLA